MLDTSRYGLGLNRGLLELIVEGLGVNEYIVETNGVFVYWMWKVSEAMGGG